MIRWLKFNAVGLAGIAVQLAALEVFSRLGIQYLLATALAVECALLHNYFWHVRWTWRGRPLEGSLLRFHLSNGLLSVAGNLVLMKLMHGWVPWPLPLQNLVAIAVTSLLNFLAGDRWVFRSQRRIERP